MKMMMMGIADHNPRGDKALFASFVPSENHDKLL